ncbi:MAG: hypothetical protein IIA72_03255 [Proteobacteria bacterium]|nr:hypothetical protein [Pseudomonadota bacterium]
MIVKIGDKKVDLAKAFPLTIGDFKGFEQLGLLDKKGAIKVDTPTKIASFLFHFIHKADKSVTEAEADSIPIADLDKIIDFFDQKIGEDEKKIDRPT